MNKFETTCAVVLMTVGALAVRSSLNVRRTEKIRRAEINAKLAADLAAVVVGAERTRERIRNGELRPRSIKHVTDELNFQIIAAHYE